jgi:hypothetical protein
MRHILFLLADNDGLADAEIAELLGVPLADLQQAARILYHQRKLDRCWQYNLLPPRAGEGRRAA